MQWVIVRAEGPLCSGCSFRCSHCSPVGAGEGERCPGGEDTASQFLRLGSAPTAAVGSQ